MSKKSLGLVVAFAMVIAACGSSGGSKAADKPTTSTKAPATSSTTAGSSGATSTTLQLISTTLGKIVADSGGHVLYLYTPDGNATVSTVATGVLAVWPPVKATAAPTVGSGMTGKAALAAQPDGQQWVSYNGHLLYTYAGDAQPGQFNGNGLAGVWYPLNAAGDAIHS